MKKTLNIRLIGLLISSLVLSSSSCKKDDERPASASNNNQGNNYQAVTGLEEGSITAEVNGKQINYTKLLKAHASLKKNLILLRAFQFGLIKDVFLKGFHK